MPIKLLFFLSLPFFLFPSNPQYIGKLLNNIYHPKIKIKCKKINERKHDCFSFTYVAVRCHSIKFVFGVIVNQNILRCSHHFLFHNK